MNLNERFGGVGSVGRVGRMNRPLYATSVLATYPKVCCVDRDVGLLAVLPHDFGDLDRQGPGCSGELGAVREREVTEPIVFLAAALALARQLAVNRGGAAAADQEMRHLAIHHPWLDRPRQQIVAAGARAPRRLCGPHSAFFDAATAPEAETAEKLGIPVTSLDRLLDLELAPLERRPSRHRVQPDLILQDRLLGDFNAGGGARHLGLELELRKKTPNNPYVCELAR